MTSTSTWIPLEGNPETFNKWCHAAGLTRLHVWEDIYGLDEEVCCQKIYIYIEILAQISCIL